MNQNFLIKVLSAIRFYFDEIIVEDTLFDDEFILVHLRSNLRFLVFIDNLIIEDKHNNCFECEIVRNKIRFKYVQNLINENEFYCRDINALKRLLESINNTLLVKTESVSKSIYKIQSCI